MKRFEKFKLFSVALLNTCGTAIWIYLYQKGHMTPVALTFIIVCGLTALIFIAKFIKSLKK